MALTLSSDDLAAIARLIELHAMNAPAAIDVAGVFTGGESQSITLRTNNLTDTDFPGAWIGSGAGVSLVALTQSGATWSLYINTVAGSATFTVTVPAAAQLPSGAAYLAGLAFSDWTLSASTGDGAAYSFTSISNVVRVFDSVATVPAGLVPTPNGDPAKTTAYTTTYNAAGDPASGVVVTFRQLAAPSGSTAGSFDTTPFTATSGSNGAMSVSLLRGTRYHWQRGTRGSGQFTTPDASTYSLPVQIGHDG